jgi:succinate-semialdehyde dehydrogenase/glutarate-semialdehyde dehydrogenase
MSQIKSHNPYNGSIIALHDQDDISSIHTKLNTALAAEGRWANSEIEHRSTLLLKVSQILLDKKEVYANLITEEMGKPISQSLAEIDKCIWACDFYAKNAENFLADELIETDASESFISYDPLGCILAIMPWNYPFWQVIRFAAPNLTAGNTAIVKHAKNVSGCAKALQELFEEAGYPQGCFQTIIAGHDDIEKLISNDGIKGVTLTGSEKAGKAIAKIAGENLKKTVLELGGNNACIVFEDADLDTYLDTMVKARYQNTGQSCIAAKRFIVCEDIYDEFVERFKNKVGELPVGNPIQENTFIGVMANSGLVETLRDQVEASIKMGAVLLMGGSSKNTFFEPTILVKVKEGMPVFDEETFGPVAAVTKVKDRKEAIKMAKESRFGLGTMLFTKDIDAAKRLVSEIPDGSFFINDMVKSDPRLPFGGTKASGFGRELSKEGMLEFVNKKTVYIKK